MRRTLPSHRRAKALHNPSQLVYVPVRSHLWSEIGLESFRKCYDVLLDHYTEATPKRPALIGLDHLGLYMKCVRFAWLGQAFSVREFATRLDWSQNTLINAIDRLQDVELLDRERCIDIQGQPIDLVLRTPLPQTKFLANADRLYKRVKEKHTAKLRRQMGKEWPGKSLPLKAMLRRIAEQQENEKLAKMERIVDAVLSLNVGSSERMSEAVFIQKVKNMCAAEKVAYNDKLLRLAVSQRRYFMKEF